MKLSSEEQKKQITYRDARFSKQYDGIWQTVGKCVFCDLNPKYVFFEESGIVLTIQLYAYIDGHMMIVPRRHVTSAKELTGDEWQAVRKCMYIAKKIIKQVHGISGMQIVQKDGADAQSTVEHLHFHAIPFDAPDLCTWNFRKLEHTPLENVALYRAANKKIEKLSAKFDEKYGQHTVQAETRAEAPAETASTATKKQDFLWRDLAFGSKKPITSLQATFIGAPRKISQKRLTQLVKQFLPKGNIVLGISEEPYVLGFEGQPQFEMLTTEAVAALQKKIQASNSPNKLYTLTYSQRDITHIIRDLQFKQAVFVRGSWKYTFHTLPQYYELARNNITYELVSPFASEAEAIETAKTSDKITSDLFKQHPLFAKGALTEEEMFEVAAQAGKQSFDYSFQTGVALGKRVKNGYTLLKSTFNRVIPFQTYALHYGASREDNFSPPGDLNHYDAVHAETELVVQAGKEGLDLANTTLFINLLPCPTCARMLAATDVSEIVYQLDHSDGYAVALLEAAGKTVRRLVPKQGKE